MRKQIWDKLVRDYLNPFSSVHVFKRKKLLKTHQKLFDTVEANPLTAKQRYAVLLNEKRNLVVAGAGTGKTSVIIAKVAYLIKSGVCKPEDILLLAFNTDAAKELSDRCSNKIGIEVQAQTFHSLGLKVIRNSRDTEPSVSKFATDPKLIRDLFQHTANKMLNSRQTWKSAKHFIVGQLKRYQAAKSFKSKDDYDAYLERTELRALSGDLVKSFQELDIANFLYTMGVRFNYERRYPGIREAYHPDFYLPDYDIWIEHFGIDRHGKTAPFIDENKYRREMEWKRNLHKLRETNLLETYSWQKDEGVLTVFLRDQLKKMGVKFRPRSDAELYASMKRQGYNSSFLSIVEQFLTHFKSNGLSIKDLKKRARGLSSKRFSSFTDIFPHFYEAYENALSAPTPPEIDFTDMIALATADIQKRRFKPHWKFIIVDEFQDISIARYKLLHSILNRNSKAKLFCVGDDWQSIYRFAGSEVDIMARFETYFGSAAVTFLDTTFRFPQKIADTSSRFIQRNKFQIRKRLKSFTTTPDEQLFVHWRDTKQMALESSSLERVQELADDCNLSAPSLLIIARYRHLLPNARQIQALRQRWRGKILAPRTVHSAKGLEADIVIVLGLGSGAYGFPTEIQDDPLLDLVHPSDKSFPNAEERRLFYVALTRSKHQTHIFADKTNVSIFARDLRQPVYDVQHVED